MNRFPYEHRYSRCNHDLSRGINDRGQLVGEFADADGRVHGFHLDNGVLTTIDAPGALGTSALDMNDRGNSIGADSDGVRLTSFLLSNGTFTTIAAPGALQLTPAYGINDRGQIGGTSF